MLDPGPDEAGRDALAQEVRGRIEGKGTLKHENKWGLRKMAYEIGGRNEADYRWLRFEAPTELLDELNHNLKIADGVLRFRIIKIKPGQPPPPEPRDTGYSREARPRQDGPETVAPRAAADAPPPSSEEEEQPAPPVEVGEDA
jgi:small subunit ribosomal protein S6